MRIPRQNVPRCRAGESLDVHHYVGALSRSTPRCQIGQNAYRARKRSQVDAATGVEGVVAGAADERVGAFPGADQVVARSAIDGVVPVVGSDYVVTRCPGDDVIAI